MIALVLLLATPAQVPANWDCAEAAYDDGAVCDCGCDVPDPDCVDGEFGFCETDGCPAGQVPWEHQNDQCMASTCGDGWKADDEACDDFNRLASGGCNADCSAVNDGFTCGEAAAGCTAAAEGEGEGEAGEGEGEGEGEAPGEGEGEDEDEEDDDDDVDGGCASTPAGLGFGLLAVLARRRRR